MPKTRLARSYTAIAILTLNTLILFAALNFAAWAVLRIREALSTSVSPAYDALVAHGFETLQRVYPGYTKSDIDGLLRESWTLALEYEPYTQFREPESSGRYVTVSPHGFRADGEGGPAWPPSDSTLNVFVFGGSTTFGYGLADGETIPAQLADRWTQDANRPTAVYNFGRAYYFSSQERVLFEQLLAAGRRPDLAIFLDGLNDTLLTEMTGGVPIHTKVLAEFVGRADLNVGTGTARNRSRSPWAEAVRSLPLVRATGGLLKTLARADGGQGVFLAAAPSADQRAAWAREITDSYRKNRQLIRAAAVTSGTRLLFALQPVPWVDYDLSHHLFKPTEQEVENLRELFGGSYALLRELAAEDTVDCSAALTNFSRPAWVDAHHYSSEAASVVVDCLLSALAERLSGDAADAADAAETVEP